MTLRSSTESSRGLPRTAALAAMLVLVLMLAGSAYATPYVQIVNPQGGDKVSNQLTPNEYIINGLALETNTVSLHITGSGYDETFSDIPVRGGAWEYKWLVPATAGDYLVSATYASPDVSVTVNGAYPAGALLLRTSSGVLGVFGGIADADDPITNQTITVLARGLAASGGNTLTQLKLEETGSAVREIGSLSLEEISNNLGWGTPFSYTVTWSATGVVKTIALSLMDSLGLVYVGPWNRSFVVDTHKPTTAITDASFPESTLLHVTGTADDAAGGSGIGSVRVRLVGHVPGDPLTPIERECQAQLTSGATAYGANWTADFSVVGIAAPYDIYSLATDNAGNPGASEAAYIDAVDPVATLDAIAAYVSGTITVEGDVSDAHLDRWKLFLDGTTESDIIKLVTLTTETSAVVSVPLATTCLSDGSHTVTLRAIDNVGRSTDAVQTFTVENLAPVPVLDTIGIVVGGVDLVNGVKDVTGSIVETNLDLWELFLDDEVTASKHGHTIVTAFWTGPGWNSASVSAGAHKFTLKVTDTAGNVGTALHTFTVDNSAPVATIFSPADSESVESTVLVTGSAVDENLKEWKLYLDDVFKSGGSTASVSATWDVSAETLGTHTIKLEVLDDLDHLTTASRDFDVASATACSTYLDDPPEVWKRGDNLTLKGGATIAFRYYRFVRVGQSPVPDFTDLGHHEADKKSIISKTNVSTDLPDGMYGWYLETEVTDGVVCTSETKSTYIDYIDPTATLDDITGQVHGGITYVHGTITVTGDVSDSHLDSWKLFCDGTGDANLIGFGSVAPATSAEVSVTTAQGNGAHTVTLRAVDKAGRSKDAVKSFTVDNLVPAPVLDSIGTIVGGKKDIEGHVNESNLASWELYLDEVTLSKSGTTSETMFWEDWDSNDVLPGPHKFTLKVTDKAGNFYSDSITFTVDNAPPVATIVSPLEGDTLQCAMLVTGTAVDDNLKEWKLYLDGDFKSEGTTTSVSDPWDISTASLGLHTIELKVWDDLDRLTTVTRGFIVASPLGIAGAPDAMIGLFGLVTLADETSVRLATTTVTDVALRPAIEYPTDSGSTLALRCNSEETGYTKELDLHAFWLVRRNNLAGSIFFSVGCDQADFNYPVGDDPYELVAGTPPVGEWYYTSAGTVAPLLKIESAALDVQLASDGLYVLKMSITGQNDQQIRVVRDTKTPKLKLFTPMAPPPPTKRGSVVPPGGVLTMAFNIEQDVSDPVDLKKAPVKQLISTDGRSLPLPAPYIEVDVFKGKVTAGVLVHVIKLSLEQAVLRPTPREANGAAVVSPDGKQGYRVTWNIPMGKKFPRGTYTVKLHGAQDIVGNTAPDVFGQFEVALR